LKIQAFAVILPSEIRNSSDDNNLKEYNYEKVYIQLGSNRSYWNKHMFGKGIHKVSNQS
jgi:hypothetical protein